MVLKLRAGRSVRHEDINKKKKKKRKEKRRKKKILRYDNCALSPASRWQEKLGVVNPKREQNIRKTPTILHPARCGQAKWMMTTTDRGKGVEEGENGGAAAAAAVAAVGGGCTDTSIDPPPSSTSSSNSNSSSASIPPSGVMVPGGPKGPDGTVIEEVRHWGAHFGTYLEVVALLLGQGTGGHNGTLLSR
ncbi:hypothetical protein E2C01_000053 [Portunus trituberculatus]|uniref:Uncharacterized protein n=1 Tax=Portunus trituberculatus TaxID=210409 RepID=A0A5B7CD36_PORTR|nr:hypothetical protein [Portunus trituberculatus]